MRQQTDPLFKFAKKVLGTACDYAARPQTFPRAHITKAQTLLNSLTSQTLLSDSLAKLAKSWNYYAFHQVISHRLLTRTPNSTSFATTWLNDTSLITFELQNRFITIVTFALHETHDRKSNPNGLQLLQQINSDTIQLFLTSTDQEKQYTQKKFSSPQLRLIYLLRQADIIYSRFKSLHLFTQLSTLISKDETICQLMIDINQTKEGRKALNKKICQPLLDKAKRALKKFRRTKKTPPPKRPAKRNRTPVNSAAHAQHTPSTATENFSDDKAIDKKGRFAKNPSTLRAVATVRRLSHQEATQLTTRPMIASPVSTTDITSFT